MSDLGDKAKDFADSDKGEKATDAGLDKVGCAKVARMASAGVARAVDPAFTPFDGDIVFCLAAGEPSPDPWQIVRLGTAAATVVATAIRDGVRSAAGT